MRPPIGPVMAYACLLLSWGLAVVPMTVLTSGNAFILLIALSSIFLLWGIWALIAKNEARFIAALGGQMAWSICALSLLGWSAVVLWIFLFAHLVAILTGTRGMWLMVRLPSTTGPANAGLKKALRRNLLLAYEWVGAAALISILFLALTPWLTIGGGGLALLMLMTMVALISFSLLALRLRGPG